MGFWIVLGIWVVAWSWIGHSMAGERGHSPTLGALTGAIMGPFGCMAIALMHQGHRTPTSGGPSLAGVLWRRVARRRTPAQPPAGLAACMSCGALYAAGTRRCAACRGRVR